MDGCTARLNRRFCQKTDESRAATPHTTTASKTLAVGDTVYILHE